MAPDVRSDDEAFLSHLFAKGTKSSNRIDARIVPLFSLQTTHLHHKRLGAAYLHAINHMCDLHTVAFNLRRRGTNPSSIRKYVAQTSKRLRLVHQVDSSQDEVHQQ